jgi:exonuclease III
MACLNINSLVAHIDQLRIFLSAHKIDILAINETKLDSTITSNEIHISGYMILPEEIVLLTAVMAVLLYQKQLKL